MAASSEMMFNSASVVDVVDVVDVDTLKLGAGRRRQVKFNSTGFSAAVRNVLPGSSFITFQ